MNKINLRDIGLSERFIQEASFYGSEYDLARVSVQHRDLYRILTECGEIQAVVSGKLNYSASEVREYPAVGDWVLVDRTDDSNGNAIIHHVLTRKSCFERMAAGTSRERQVVAANMDTVFICMALNNDYNLQRLERYLSIVWDSRATPVVILTKRDLCEDVAAKRLEVESVALGADIVITSGLDDDCRTEFTPYISDGKTAAFIGSSGVGKSTLINRLIGEERLETREIRNDDRGRHTTTHRQLILLPRGGIVIDTPGMRELQLSGADLAQSFSDIEQLAEGCRFKDCSHENEPGCDVRRALEDGDLTERRYGNYKKLQKELLFEERRSSMTVSQAEKQKMIDMMGSLDAQKQFKQNHRKYKGK